MLSTQRGCAAEHTDSVEAVGFSPTLPAAVTASMDGTMMVWDNSTLALRATCQHSEVACSAQDPPGAGSVQSDPASDPTSFLCTRLYQEASLSDRLAMQGVVALVCHPMAPMAFTGCLDGVLRAWDIRTGATLMVLSAYHLRMWHWKLLSFMG